MYNIIQQQGVKLSVFAVLLSVGMPASAQEDEFDEETTETTAKAPRRQTHVEKNTLITVKGFVYDLATKKPLAGARLQTLDDQRYAAMTNAQGEFSINVPDFATSLFVQAPNYLSQQVGIKAGDEKQTVKINMLSNNFSEMYQNGTTITATNSFNSDGNGLTIDEEIGEKLGADIRTIMHSGNLENGASMFIRGINSINASSQPLVILDGVELDMQRNRTSLHTGDIFNMLSTITPEDIDKVTVLKNATALYGARGANGVILIETKRGHSMATRIDAKVGVGTTLMPSTPTMMNASQYRSYAVEMLGTISDVQTAAGNLSTAMTFNFLDDNPNGYYYNTYHNDTDWKDYVYKTALTHNYSINVQGGDDVGMYNLSVAYIQTLKNVETTKYDRVNVRFNTDINILDNLSTKFDMSFSRSNTSLFDDGIPSDLSSGTITSPTFLALIKSPLLNPYQYNQNVGGFTSLLSDADDLFDGISNTSLANPAAIIENAHGSRKNRNENTFFNIAVAPTYAIAPTLKLTTHFSYYLNRNNQAYYRPNGGVPSYYVEGLGTVYSKTASIFSKENNIISNTHLDWANKYGANDISVTGGFRYTSFSYTSSELASENSTSSDYDKNPSLSSSSTDYSTVSGADDNWKNMQWYLSGDYNYANKYFATVSVLAEANSRFGDNASGTLKAFGTRWAFFPSVQLGWVMSNEKWFPKNSAVNYLRLNAGFDMSGNDDISNYAASTYYSAVRYNGTQLIGAQLDNIGNDEVKWETTKKFNVGVQANMFNNRLSAGFDFYIHHTSDLLSLKDFESPVGGINQYYVNDGSVRNTGFEFSISGKPVVKKDLQFEIGGSMGHYKNTVKSLVSGSYTTSIYGTDNILTAVGESVGTFYGYETAGVFSTTEEASSAGVSHVNSNGETTSNLYMIDDTGAKVDFQAGDVHFVDQNGDGVIDENDKVVIGNPNPDIYGNIFATLTWKRFTLGLNFNYSVGNDIYNYQRSVLNSGSTLYNQQVSETGHWRYEGQETDLPRLNYGDPMENNRFSDRWIEDGSYLRLKTLSITYRVPIPESWLSWLQGISVWGECGNLFTITKYTGNDPELSISNNQLYQGIDAGNIAQGRTFTFGLKVNL